MEVVTQVLIMSILIIIGMALYKIKIIDNSSIKTLSNIVVHIANPAAVFLAFRLQYSEKLMQRLGYALLLAGVVYIVVIAGATLFVRNKDREKQSIERVSAVLSNCGFMGIPLVRGIFGDEGVFFLAAFIAVNNLVTWTYGVAMISGNASFKSLLKTVNSPMIYAIFLGFIFYAFKIPIPEVPLSTIELLAGMTMPSAMLAAGGTIVQADFKKVAKNIKIYYVSIIKLIIIPLLLYFVFLSLPRDGLIMSVHLTACACPTATLCTVLAIRYDKDGVYASEIFAVATLLSMLTIPLIIQLPF
ncbi:MAG: AEC family transporter [Eubacterium sp.]|nr:AEC family transporter [Eubacterium sp.]